MRTTVLLPEAVVAAAAAVFMVVPALVGPRSRASLRRFIGWVAAAAALAALGLELWLGAGLGTLFDGGVIQDRFALFAKAAALLGLAVSILAADWDAEPVPGALPMAFLAALGVMVAASATTLAALWTGLALACLAVVAGLSRRVRGEALIGEDEALRAGVARASVLVVALLMVLALALAFLSATAGTSVLAGLQTGLAGRGALVAPAVLPALLGLGSVVALLLLAPLRFGVPAVAASSPLAAGAAAGLGAAAAGLVLVRLGAALLPLGPGWGPGLAGAAAAASLLAGIGVAAGPAGRAGVSLLGVGQLAWVVAAVATHGRAGVAAGLLLLGSAVLGLAAAPVLPVAAEAGPAAGLVGLSERQPGRAAGLAVAALSLAGVPPLAGFFGTFATASALLGSGRAAQLGVLLLGWLLAAVGAARVVHAAFLAAEVEGHPAPGTARRPGAALGWAGYLAAGGAMAAAVVMLAYGLFANPISGLAYQGAEALGLR